jgi:hypothetical protein
MLLYIFILIVLFNKKVIGEPWFPGLTLKTFTLPTDGDTFIRTENPATHGDYKCTGFRYLYNIFLFAGTLTCKEPNLFLHFPWILLHYNTYCFM